MCDFDERREITTLDPEPAFGAEALGQTGWVSGYPRVGNRLPVSSRSSRGNHLVG